MWTPPTHEAARFNLLHNNIIQPSDGRRRRPTHMGGNPSPAKSSHSCDKHCQPSLPGSVGPCSQTGDQPARGGRVGAISDREVTGKGNVPR
jgi:hypothetical protein